MVLEMWKNELNVDLPESDTIVFQEQPIPPEPILLEGHVLPAHHEILVPPQLPDNDQGNRRPKFTNDNDSIDHLFADNECDLKDWEKSTNSSSSISQAWEKSSLLQAYRSAESEYEREHKHKQT